MSIKNGMRPHKRPNTKGQEQGRVPVDYPRMSKIVPNTNDKSRNTSYVKNRFSCQYLVNGVFGKFSAIFLAKTTKLSRIKNCCQLLGSDFTGPSDQWTLWALLVHRPMQPLIIGSCLSELRSSRSPVACSKVVTDDLAPATHLSLHVDQLRAFCTVCATVCVSLRNITKHSQIKFVHIFDRNYTRFHGYRRVSAVFRRCSIILLASAWWQSATHGTGVKPTFDRSTGWSNNLNAYVERLCRQSTAYANLLMLQLSDVSHWPWPC